MSLTSCDHAAFTASVGVFRLTDGGGHVAAYTAEVKVTCSACGTPFVFSAPLGVNPTLPTMSLDGQTLRAPIAPAGADPVPALSRPVGEA